MIKRELIIIAGAIAIIAFFGYIFSSIASAQKSFVRGKESKYCYEIHDYPHQIRNFCYYNSYEDCESSLKFIGKCNQNDK